MLSACADVAEHVGEHEISWYWCLKVGSSLPNYNVICFLLLTFHALLALYTYVHVSANRCMIHG